MKANIQFLTVIIFTCISQILLGQELSDKQIKDKVIKDINNDREEKVAQSEKKINEYQLTVEQLETQSAELRKNKDRIENLLERINALEEKNSALHEKELSLYAGNYQTAVINLVFLETDLQPLNLFQSSRTFFTSLNDISNPMNYPEYKEWYSEFKSYIDAEKDKEISLLKKDKLNLKNEVCHKENNTFKLGKWN